MLFIIRWYIYDINDIFQLKLCSLLDQLNSSQRKCIFFNGKLIFEITIYINKYNNNRNKCNCVY